MVAYNFQARFAPMIQAGQKTSTIRPRGKRRHARRGDALQLYTGMRQKSCRKLLDATCSEAVEIDIAANGVTIGGVHMGSSEWLASFAQHEGFSSFDEMLAWFDRHHGLPIRDFVLISWSIDAEGRP